MASSIVSVLFMSQDANGMPTATEVPFDEIQLPKQTAIDKMGGILCYICDSKYGNKKDFESHFATHNAGMAVFTCVACNKQHASYQSFRNHCYLQHIVKDKFVCHICKKSFPKQSILTSHVSAIHEFKCGDCDQLFTTKKELTLHKVVHNKKGKDEPPYKCNNCSKVINSIDGCESHMDDHCQIAYVCPICETVLPTKQEAAEHVTQHFDQKLSSPAVAPTTFKKEDSSIDSLGGILCTHCHLLFKNRTEFEAHFTSEHEDKVIVYTCNICDKQYTSYSLFGNHCYYHTASGSFQCDQCERVFPRLSLLVLHNLAFHSDGATDKPFQCDKCVHSLKTYYRLVEHKRLVHDEASIKCQHSGCSAVLDTVKDLVEHQRLHKSCLDNWCRQCGLQFATPAACVSHLDIHRRKRYACPVCPRQYRERYLMLKHLTKHFESVLHICKVCSRSYVSRNRLVEHLKSHSISKYQCTYCSKGFLKQYQLEQHERMHTGIKPYQCSVCQRTFASYPNWTKHLTRVHSFDKNMIKEAREKYYNKTNETQEKSSPLKPESGIESAGSEVSDLYGFQSDDSEGTYTSVNNIKLEINKIIMENIDANDTTRNESITETVNAVIDRIDSMDDLDIIAKDMPGSEFTNFNDCNTKAMQRGSDFTGFGSDKPVDRFANYNDASDIKAIVEHIDALSGGLEMEPISQPGTEHLMQFTEMMPVGDIVYDSVPVYTPQPVAESAGEYYQPISMPLEFGPDFNTPGSVYTTDAMNNDHVLPHIDPLLTIRAEQNAKIFLQNPSLYETVPSYGNWDQPIIAKVFSYDETNDVNRMFVLNGHF